jgi:hypothetical protein
MGSTMPETETLDTSAVEENEPKPSWKDLDFVTILAVPGLVAVSCFALWIGSDTVAGTAAGALAGIVTRIYK